MGMPGILERWRSLFKPNITYQVTIGGDAPTSVLNYTAKKLYQTQDNLKAVVDFLSNSIAQLPLKVYVRDGETDRRRDRDSVAAKLIWRPNADQTEFEFIRALALEYFIFGNVYVWLLPDPESESGYQLRIVPDEWVVKQEGRNLYAAETITIWPKNKGAAVQVPRSEFVQFRTYSPSNPGGFVSPMSALRQTLQEQIEASNFRKQLWHSSGRLNAQITRPANVAPWDDQQRQRFVTMFRESWGSNGENAGKIPVLEDGMKIEPFQTSFKEAEWTASVKLSREAVAAAYGINPSLVWHSDSQTYASAKDNARALYADCLGPTLQMLQQRINSFLLPMIGADPDTYVEFDLTEKLKGSFEERASILQSSVGGPWMTRNEARADNNLPPIEGGDELIVPLNVVEGGQASPTDTHMNSWEPVILKSECGCLECKSAQKKISVKARSTKEEDEKMAEILARFWKRQASSVLPKIGAKSAEWWDEERWNDEMTEDILPLINAIADAHGKETADVIGSAYNTEQTRAYLRAVFRPFPFCLKTRFLFSV
jgi:HK97 family phage portal protein